MSEISNSKGDSCKVLDTFALLNYIRDLRLNEPKSRLQHKKRNRLENRSTLKSVLFILALRRNNVTAKCCPDIRTIADESGCSKDTARRTIDDLISRGILIMINLGGKGSNIRNRYFFRAEVRALKSFYDDHEHPIHLAGEVEYLEELFSRCLP